jgi:transposase
MGLLGLVPSEYSSGEERHRGSIRKTGNPRARRLLVEAAWHYQHAPRLAARQRAQAELVPVEVLARVPEPRSCVCTRATSARRSRLAAAELR